VYLVTVEGRIETQAIEQLTRGIDVRDQRLVAARVELRKASSQESHLTVTLTEGKNREVRRLLEAVGHPVTRLRRVQIGGLELGDLAPGRWRKVSAAEVWAAFPSYSPRKRMPSPK
jgi:23S rRNA pseudouridine2605 synthase